MPSSPFHPSTDSGSWYGGAYYNNGLFTIAPDSKRTITINYKLLKDVLHHPRQKDIGQPIKLRCGPLLETALGHIIHLQTPEKDAWTIFDLTEQQDVLANSQLLTVDRSKGE